MLTIKQCRQLLGDEKMSDQQIKELLEAIHVLNAKFLNEYFKEELSDDV